MISEISGDPSVFIQNAERKKNLEQRRRLIIKKVLDIDSDAPADDVAIQAIACKMEAESFISDYPEELDS
ncbi:hypothetical protein [Aliikangiella coralliicola]|uniref:Uncharacterized protein n=1 Tax=Aliikangiella coralliicola TaxID=2592383 RepID=A0A545U032_9GAMM|nr:hypothetical protein [Aliikangiella coralliicola]TQV82828.1 hypothetical protein FLL46_23965 [Aliikangiella coralliicola]